MAENMEKIRPALIALEVGAIYNRQFKTRADREKQTITVMRTL